MRFKALICGILATSMIFTSTPVFASSNNSINKTKTVAVDDYINDIYLKIQPNDAITTQESIEITIENSEFFTDDDDNFDYTKWSANGYTWETAVADLKDKENILYSKEGLFNNNNSTLPYKILKRGNKTIEVCLFPISEDYVGKDNINGTKPYYYIPINCKATKEGDLNISINANETSISGGGTYTVASIADSDGSTKVTINEVNSFDDDIILEDITIKENVKGSLEAGTIKLRLSNGFVFSSNQDKFEVIGGININDLSIISCKVDEDQLTFELPEEVFPTSKASSIIIKGLKILSDDDDKWGDVNLSISGAGVTKETIKVATRADYGFEMEREDEIPTIYAGRAYVFNDDIDEEFNESAEIKFSELIENTYIGERPLQFSVPEGIKIFGYEMNNVKYFNFSDSTIKVKDDGTVLEIGKGVIANSSDISEFKLKLYLSADADFVGDVPLSVKGAGIGEGVIDDVIIAKVITPISITTEATKANLGYQAITANDIKITEKESGVLLKDKKVEITLDGLFGGKEIGFADDDSLDYEIDGDLEIKELKVTDGKIVFTIDKTSNVEPSTITIKNIIIGSTRSVPYGSYNLKIAGEAIINNYDEDADDIREDNNLDYPCEITEDTDYKELAYFDTTEAYNYLDYFTIKTATGTLDNQVSVTIGDTICYINNKSYEMDVAPYIQATSNSTLVPLRFVAIALGLDDIENPDESNKVVWDNINKKVTLYYGQGTNQKIIQFTNNSNEMLVDGTKIDMPYGVTAEITNSRMFVPFRALGQALGVNVSWDSETKTATYNK